MELNQVPLAFRSQLDNHFGHSEYQVVRAPGRINLIGEHTDYNGGHVLPGAIDKYCYFAWAPHIENMIVAHALDLDSTVTIEIDELEKTSELWANYLIGLLLEFRKRKIEFSGFRCVITSDVPMGAGMSSSAALECSILLGLQKICKTTFNLWELIIISQSSNHHFLGIKGGIMDQFSSLAGRKDHVMLLDCNHKSFRYIDLQESAYSWLLINSGVKHNHIVSGYNDRVKECKQALQNIQVVYPDTNALCDISSIDILKDVVFDNDIIAKRAHFVIAENQRVLSFVSELNNTDYRQCGNLLYASHIGLSQLYEVSCRELDYLVDILRPMQSVLGSRMMGGGFGGCTINLVKTSEIDSIKTIVYNSYKDQFGIDPIFYPVNISAGAQ